jgi:hypothetical protein
VSPFIHRCQCRRGFFALRPCDAAAAHTCGTCRREVCDEHWSPAPPGLCLDCAARANERYAAGDYDPYWTHSYRHYYYTTTGYRPIYYGPDVDPYYNDYDVRAFDRTDAAPTEDAIDGGDDVDAVSGGDGGLDDS